MQSTPRALTLLLSFALPLSALSPQQVSAAPPQLSELSLIERLPEIEQRVNTLTRTYLDPALRVRANRFAVKLTEGRVKYLSEDYRGAAMILLELVETYDQDKSSLLYKEALFYLADSLYHIGNLKTAGRMFEELINKGSSSARVCALGRLLEIAVSLKQPELASRYQAEAMSAVARQPDPHILYQLGKYSYERERFEEAQRLWAQVERGASVYPQALYFSAVADVRRGRLKEALDAFERVRSLDLKALRAEREERQNSEAPGSLNEQLARTNELRRDQSPSKPRCTFRSTQEQNVNEKGWELVVAQAALAVARLFYESSMLEEAADAYLNIPRGAPVFREAIEESVWVAIKQGAYQRALQRLDVQLIDEPELLNNPNTRLLQGQLMSILGRFGDARGLFQEIRERFELLKARDIAPILRRAKGQLARYFQERLKEGNLALNLESLIPKSALHFAKGELSSSAARSLFVELAALRNDVNIAKEDLKMLRWVLDAPNRSEIYPQIHEGLLKALELRTSLLTIQRQSNERAGGAVNSAEYQALRAESERAHKALIGVPTSSLGFQEREAGVERSLLKADLSTSRLTLALRNVESQLIALKLYLKSSKPDAVGGALGPRERAAALKQLEDELAQNERLKARAQGVSDTIHRTQLRVGLYDEAFMLEEALRDRLRVALEAESEWLATHGKLSPELLRSLSEQHAIISDFQTRSLKLVRNNSQELKDQLAAEEQKIAAQEERLNALASRAHMLGGQIVAYTFYRVLEEINAFLLEADAGLLDVSWSQKSQRTDLLFEERAQRRVHLKVIQRDLADAPR
jgi:hypothetical protein